MAAPCTEVAVEQNEFIAAVQRGTIAVKDEPDDRDHHMRVEITRDIELEFKSLDAESRRQLFRIQRTLMEKIESLQRTLARIGKIKKNIEPLSPNKVPSGLPHFKAGYESPMLHQDYTDFDFDWKVPESMHGTKTSFADAKVWIHTK